jgi:hypothetical protein
MTEEKKEQHGEHDDEGETTEQEAESSNREAFFENLEQVTRPDNESNGDEARDRESGSNPDPSI